MKISRNYGRILGLAAISTLAAFSQAEPIKVRVNGQLVEFSGAQPHMMGDQVIVPIRSVIEAAGGSVDWNPTDKTVTAQKGTVQLEIQVTSEVAKVNGSERIIGGPIHIMDGWTMVPARFIADSLGASIEFDGYNEEVALLTSDTEPTMNPSSTEVTPVPETSTTPPPPDMSIQPVGSALKVKLDKELSSSTSYVGELFTATVDTNGNSDYFGLPDGTMVRGHVTFVQPMRDGMPGILGITFDELILNDGRTRSISATPIDVYSDIETGEDGRWMTTPNGQSKSDLKYIGVDSSSGTLVPLVTDSTSVSIEEIDQAMPNRGEPYEVVLTEGTLLGVRIDRDGG